MADYRNSGFDGGPTSRTGVWTTRKPEIAVEPVTEASTAPAAVLAPASSLQRRRRFRISWRAVIRTASFCAGAISIAFALLIFSYRWIDPPSTTLILTKRLQGVPIDRKWLPLDQISTHLARAVIMSEDAGFCGHRGVDFAELERAYDRGFEGGMRGGSTVAMQVVKNLFLWPSRSYIRKALEIPMTLVADHWWGKRRMLEIYLNIVEWGPGIFGAEAAARTYFDKPASKLTEREAALLAVALPNPLSRNSADPSDLQQRLATVVQGRMRVGTNNVRCLRSTTPGE